MVLGRSEILALLGGSGLIEGYSLDCLGGAGYDLRADRVYRIRSESSVGASGRTTPKVEEAEFGSYALKPGEYVLLETLEKVNMPPGLAARILPRSTIFRCGCGLYTALVDPGFRGTLTMGLKNLSDFDFTLERHARVAQIVFERVEGKTTEYSGKYQGGKVV